MICPTTFLGTAAALSMAGAASAAGLPVPEAAPVGRAGEVGQIRVRMQRGVQRSRAAMLGLSAEAWTAVILSVRVASVATLASLVPGLLVALALARGRFPGRGLLDVLVHLPLVLPPVVTGYLLLVAFGRRGLVGGALAEIGIVFAFRWTGAALACAVMGFPLMVRAMRLSIEAVDRRLEEAAGTLGAGRLATFLVVTLPLALPGVVAGAVLSFAKAMGEFGATITFVSSIPGETETLPSAIYALTQVPGAEAAALKLVAVSLAISVVALAAAEWIGRRVSRRIAVA